MSDIIDKKTDHGQTPIHEIHLAGANQPANKRPAQTTVPTSNSIKSSGDWQDTLTELFDVLISNMVSEQQRIELKERMEILFAPNAQVRILGQDTETAVDRESASAYIGRRATSRLLLKVVVVDGELNANGQISSLKVREIYKK